MVSATVPETAFEMACKNMNCDPVYVVHALRVRWTGVRTSSGASADAETQHTRQADELTSSHCNPDIADL